MNSEMEQLFVQAYTLQHEGKLQEAISTYQALLKLDPKHLETLHFLGLAYAQFGDMNNAINYLEQAALSNADNPALLNNLANAYKKSNRIEEAISHYLKAIEIQPDYAQAHNNLATLYAAQNKYQQALTHYKEAVHAAPDFTAAHFNLGLLLMHNNQLAAAEKQFNNVLSLDPDNIDAQFYSGILYLEQQLLPEAEQAFQRVIESDCEHVQALTNLGVIALKQNENQKAVDFFTKALALDNEHVDARNNLAATFMHHDRFENALMHYDVLLKKDPANSEYLYNSGVAQMALGHLNEALIHFEELLNTNNEHSPSLNNMAAIYLKLDEKAKAQTYLKRALAINPKDTISKHMLQALSGNTLDATTTPEYAHNLFNNYALYYDQHMQGLLQYTIPQYISRTLHQLHLIKVKNTLDLGCGTGLSGVVLREISEHLTGVDIAAKMLALAKEKSIYDELAESELIDFLKQSQQHYDLIVAADVLPYFGDLGPLFKAIKKHVQPEGHFIFTTEISSKEPWHLEISARFSHNPDYIKNLAEQCSFQIIKQEKIPARLQDKQPLEVMLYVFKP